MIDEKFRIDLRSDTVTQPSMEMRKVMANALTGDDVFAEDPKVNELQAKCAEKFNMEAGLFCPSGTMTNQIAISVHTAPGDEVICDKLAHIYNYEGGGIARLSGASVRLLEGDRGRFTAESMCAAINPSDSHYARTTLVSLEDTCNKGGGAVWDLEKMAEVSSEARSRGLSVHLDGARVWNALVARGIHQDAEACKNYGENFDSISLCFSKGLGCPIGSVLIGSREFIDRAHRVRKVLGGGMRQAGIVASAGVYSMSNLLDRLAEDHENARALGEAALKNSDIKSVLPIDTNIVIIELKEGLKSDKIAEKWNSKGILCFPFSNSSIRFVTHLDNTEDQIKQACKIISSS